MFKTVSESTKKQRLKICSSCDEFNKKIKTCKQCGCYMPAKATFASSECPLLKWNIEETHTSNLVNQIEEAILESWSKL